MTTKPPNQNEIQNAIDQVKQRFLMSLSQYRSELNSYLGMIRSGDQQYQGLDGIRVRAHKIHGIAATLGFHELGKEAAKLESTILKMSESSSSHNDTARDFVTAYNNLYTILTNLDPSLRKQ